MDWRRFFRHFFTTQGAVAKAFPKATLDAIEAAVRGVEHSHDGQIRFVVEAALGVDALWQRQSSRARAIEVFASQGVWDTERNNGVLLYVLLADHAVEILCDRGINAQVPAEAWQAICRTIEADFRAGRFQQGAIQGVNALKTLLLRHYSGPDAPNDLPDRPALI